MKNLVYKELKLVVAPFIYMFPALSMLLLVPDYPYAVSMSYCIYGIFITFNLCQVNKDMEFTANLPVPRRYVVYSRYITIIYLELLQIIVAIPFAIISSFVLHKDGNIVGMDANLAFFGMTFISYGIFNSIFLPKYFKTGYKMTGALISSLSVYVVLVVLSEILIAFIPALHGTLDGLSPEKVPIRLAILLGGIVIYILLNVFSSKKAVKNFEKVSI